VDPGPEYRKGHGDARGWHGPPHRAQRDARSDAQVAVQVTAEVGDKSGAISGGQGRLLADGDIECPCADAEEGGDNDSDELPSRHEGGEGDRAEAADDVERHELTHRATEGEVHDLIEAAAILGVAKERHGRVATA
jgi:hypothetical protein